MQLDGPFVSIEEEVAHLCMRGLCGDPAEIASRLEVVNYHRLREYWHPLCSPEGVFRPGVHINDVWMRYGFDRKMRLLMLDAIERIEVCIRAKIARLHAFHHGAYGYVDDPASLLTASGRVSRSAVIERIRKDGMLSKHEEVQPIWIATEMMSLGTIVAMFKICLKPIRRSIASDLGTSDRVLYSWLLALNAARNVAAHHGRMWNRELGIKPLIPLESRDELWHAPYSIPNNRIFALLSICKYMLDVIEPSSGWSYRLSCLMHDYPEIPLHPMGMRQEWYVHALWDECRMIP